MSNIATPHPEPAELDLRELLQFNSNMKQLVALATAVHGILPDSQVHKEILAKLDPNTLWNIAYNLLRDKHTAKEIIEYVEATRTLQEGLTDSMKAVGEYVHSCIAENAIEMAV